MINPDIEEVWCPIVGYENLYEVSSFGRVRSLDRWIPQKGPRKEDRVNFYKGQLLSPKIPKNKYPTVNLKKRGSNGQMFLVHRLVALHFTNNPRGRPEVNHIDGNKLNPRAANLEWVNRQENVRHSWETGLVTYENRFSKLSESDVIKIKELVSQGYLHKSVAQMFNIHKDHVKNILSGVRWNYLKTI